MPTGQAIREELNRYGLIQLLGTATATGSTDYITDTIRLASFSHSSSAFDDCWVRASSGTYDGGQTKADYIDVDDGRLYVTPSFAGDFPSAATYEVWRPGVDPDDVDRARDEALTRICSQWYIHPLSELQNAAFVEDLGTTWTAGNSATLAKQTLSFPTEFARDSLLVTNDGATANGAADSASIYVRPGQQFYLYVPVSVRSGTAAVIVRDVTGSADISLSQTSEATGRGWTGIEVWGTVPSSCYEVQVWLRGEEINAVAEWGPVNFHWLGQTQIGLPARVTSRTHVGPIYAITDPMRVGTSTYWAEDQKHELTGIRKEQIGDSVRLRFETSLTSYPYFYTERTFYSALSTAYQTVAQRIAGDAATTLCPTDYVASATVRVLAEQYINKQPSDREFWTSLYGQAQADLDIMEREYGPKPYPTQERGRFITVPHLKV